MVLLPADSFRADTFPVPKTDDTNDGTCDPDCSLREAIDAANTNPGADDVPVPAGFYLLTLGQLVVSEALATTFSSAEASTARVYN
jgi:CSLREA domain-containing protein